VKPNFSGKNSRQAEGTESESIETVAPSKPL